MRILSLNFRQALFAQEASDVPIFLLTITHSALADSILLTTDPTERLSTDPLVYGTTSRGQEYLFAGVDITLPDEQDRKPPTSRLSVENVTRSLIPLARSVATPAKVLIEAVLASDADVVETTFAEFDMTNLVYDTSVLTFDLTIDALATEPYPAGSFSPASFPGLFY